MVVLFIALIVIKMLNFEHYDLTAIYYGVTMWVFSMGIVFNAIYQKEKGVLRRQNWRTFIYSSGRELTRSW